MVTISLEYIFFVVIASAAFTGILLFLTSRWLDIQGYRYQLDAQRYAIDVLNLIISNSPIVERFEDEEPNRLILNAEKLNDYSFLPWENWDYRRKFWQEHFELLEFEYEINIEDLITHKSWKFSNLYFEDSECYYEAMRISGYVDAPVVISYGSEKHPGKASIKLKRTPLSELAFFLSEAFMRSEMNPSENYLRGIRVDTTNIKGIDVLSLDGSENVVCLKHIKDGNEIKVCKYFYRNEKELKIDDSVKNFNTQRKCIDVIVRYFAQEGKVGVVL